MNINISYNPECQWYSLVGIPQPVPVLEGEEPDDLLLYIRVGEGGYYGGDPLFDFENIDQLVEALYDAYQCQDQIEHGDKFLLNNEEVARCESVHVLKTTTKQLEKGKLV